MAEAGLSTAGYGEQAVFEDFFTPLGLDTFEDYKIHLLGRRSHEVEVSREGSATVVTAVADSTTQARGSGVLLLLCCGLLLMLLLLRWEHVTGDGLVNPEMKRKAEQASSSPESSPDVSM